MRESPQSECDRPNRNSKGQATSTVAVEREIKAQPARERMKQRQSKPASRPNDGREEVWIFEWKTRRRRLVRLSEEANPNAKEEMKSLKMVEPKKWKAKMPLKLLSLHILLLAQLCSPVSGQRLTSARDNISIIEDSTADSPGVSSLKRRSLIKTWPPVQPGSQELAPAASQRQQVSFAIEPPALVEYSNSTGAIVHCRPQQQQAATVSVGWRVVRATQSSFEEQELPAEQSPGRKWSAGGRRRYVRRDGALVLAPFAANQLEPELHSAWYRCCLTASAGPPRDGAWRASPRQVTVCSRLVKTRAVPDTQVALAVYDKFAQANTLAVLKCQAPAELQAQLEFGAWLRDDKILSAVDERKCARRLQELAAGRIGPLAELPSQPQHWPDDELKYLTTARGELIIRNVSKQLDAGTYKCRAKNKLTGQFVTSAQGGRLIVEEAPPEVGKPTFGELTPSSVVFAQEGSDVLICAEFHAPAQDAGPTPKPRQTNGRHFRWFRWLDGQRVPIAPSQEPDQPRQAYHRHQNAPDSHQQPHFRQLDSCLLVSQVQAGHAGDYTCDAQSASGGLLRQRLALLVSSTKLDVQLALSMTNHQRPSLLSVSGSQQMQFVGAGAALELNCSVSAPAQHQDQQTWPPEVTSLAWFRDGRLLFLSQLAGSAVSSDASPSSTPPSNVRLIQPNVIAIEPFSTSDRGVYQCLAFSSSQDGQSGDHQDYLLDLMMGGGPSPVSRANSSSASLASRRNQLRSSDEFRHVSQLFDVQLGRNRLSLSSSAAVQLEPVPNKPQLVQKFAAIPSALQVGGRLSLECLASGAPVPKIIWLLDDFVIRDQGEDSTDAVPGQAGPSLEQNYPNELINDQGRFRVSWRASANQMSAWSQLNVTNLQLVDSGQYKCLALNQHGQAQHAAQVSVLGGAEGRALLRARSYQPQNVTLIAGQNATLHCPLVAAGHSPVRFDWFHSGQRLPASHRHQVLAEMLPSSSSSSSRANNASVLSSYLHLENVDPSQDAGAYNCQAQFSANAQANEALDPAQMELQYNLQQSAGSQMHVAVHVPPLIDGQSLPDTIQANEGMRTKLVCSIVQGDHPLDIKWIRRADDQNKTIKLLSGRLLAGYELMQNMPSQGDQQDEDSSAAPANQADDERANQLLAHQDAVTLHNLDDSCLLTFKQITHYDRGEYICLAQNRLSLSMRQVRVVVNVAPSWSVEPPSDVYVLLGQRLQVDCLAHGHPQPVATWRRGAPSAPGAPSKSSVKQVSEAQFVDFVPSYKQRATSNGSLIIEQVEQAEVFICEQANGIGSGLSKLVNVHVQVPPFFLVKQANGPLAKQLPAGGIKTAMPAAQIGRLGSNVELKCLAAGDQPMLIGWRKDLDDVIDLRSDKRRLVSSELKTLAGPNQEALESTLSISDLTRQDSGQYSCIASNEFGTQELRLQLLVQEAPEEPHLQRPIKTEPRQATLTFRRPFDGNNPIRKYAIHYRQANELDQNIRENELSLNASSSWKQVLVEAQSGAQQQIELRDLDQLVSLGLCCLKPFTRYLVRVSAVNEIGQSAASKPVGFQTDEEAIGGPPLDVSVEPTGAHSLKVRWREPSRLLQNGLIRGYYIGYRALIPLGNRQSPFLAEASGQSSDAGEQYQYKNVQLDLSGPSFAFGDQSAAPNLTSASLLGGGAKTDQQVYSTYLTNLRRKTAYSIIVQAYNKIGAGPRSDQIIVSTLDAAPPMSPQLKLVATSYNSAEFVWANRRFGLAASPDRPAQATTPLDAEQQLSQLGDFAGPDDDDPQAYYTVNYKLDERYFAQSQLSGGAPTTSEWLQQKLTRPVLAGPQSQQVAVDQPRPASQQQRLSFVLNSLKCGSAYLAYMTATNSLGQSEPGETVKFNTRGGAPVAPTSPSDFLVVNSTFLLLRFGAWSNAGCPIGSFLIKYKPDNQPKWTVIEHQVYPTIQTTTVAGSSAFSTRPILQQANQLINSQHIQSEAAAQQRQLSAAQLSQRHRPQQVLNDLILRNLSPNSNYKLSVEANSEAGATAAEYDFETANYTSTLVAVNVRGLVADDQQDAADNGQLTSFGRRGHDRNEPDTDQRGVGNSIMNSFMLGGAGGAGGGIWQANKQTLGVWSLTVLFVAASILMAITTLALGFKSLLRMKHNGANSSPGGANGRASSLDNLVSTLLCCSTSSSSASNSSSGAGSNSSRSSRGCYQLASERANQDSSKNVYCALPNGGGGHHFDLANHHHQRLNLESPAANTDLGALSISGLLRDERPVDALETSLTQHVQGMEVEGRIPTYRQQMVSSSSLSALLSPGSCLAQSGSLCPSGNLSHANGGRNTLTLAPLSRLNRMTEERLQQLNQTLRANSHYAATMGRQQHHHQHQELQQQATSFPADAGEQQHHQAALYGQIMQANSKQLSLNEQQAVAMTMQTQAQNGCNSDQADSSYLSFPAANLADEFNSATSGYSTAPSLTGCRPDCAATSNASFRQRQADGRQQAFKKFDCILQSDVGPESCSQLAESAYRSETNDRALEAFLQHQHEQRQAEQYAPPATMSSAFANHTGEQQQKQNQGQQQQQQQLSVCAIDQMNAHPAQQFMPADAYGALFGHHHHQQQQLANEHHQQQ